MEKKIFCKLINMSVKLFFRLILLCFMAQASFASFSHAQMLKDVYLTIEKQNANLVEVLSEIETKTNFKFAYSEDLLKNTDVKVNLNSKNENLENILNAIASQTGFSFVLINNTITIKKEYDSDLFISGRGKIIGKIYDYKTNQPLIGANIILKGTNIGTSSDADGNYRLEIPKSFNVGDEVTVTVKYIGYKTLEKKVIVSGKIVEVNFALREDVFESETVIVTGAASKTSKSVAEVAVSRIKADQLTQKQVYTDVSQLLSGKVAGVRIENTSGGPGSGIRFNVRAGGGLNGNGQPLIIIDGVRMENFEVGGDRSSFGNSVNGAGFNTLSELNPEDIENIEILKGPAAAASYGTDGSNGVVLITTKRGRLKEGALGKNINISVKHVSGWNERSQGYENVYPYTYQKVHKVFRDGPIEQNSIGITGGIPTLRYYVGFNRRNEDGILPNQYLYKDSYRANFDAFPNDKINLSVNASYSQSEQRRTEGDNNTRSLIYNTSREPTWKWADSAAILARQNLIYSDRFIGSVIGKYKPIEGLEAKASLGMDYSQIKDLEYTPPGLRLSSNKNKLTQGNRDVRHRRNIQYTYNFDATYNWDLFSDIKVTSIIGAQLFERRLESFAAETDTFTTPLISDLDAGKHFSNIGESFLHLRNGGIFTEQSFSYNDTYRLSLMLRKDYASTIGEEAPSIIYPKASISVRLDKLNLVPKNIFGLFKFRAAYGETGQLPGSRDAIRLLWGARRNPYGVGARLADIGNSEIKPERIKEIELGFDTEFLNDYSFEFTYYKSFASNSIIRFENAPSTGMSISTVPKNIGKVEGWGIETLFSGRPVKSEILEVNFSLVNSYQDNEVKDLGGAQPIFAPDRGINVIKEGLPKWAFYDYKVLGAKFDENGVYAGPKFSEEKEYLGTPIPTYTGSFSLNITLFRDLEIYFMAEWATGHSILNYTKRQAIRDGNGPEIRELSDLVGIDPLTNKPVDWFPDRAPLTPGTPEYIEAANKLARLTRTSKSNGGYIEPADFLKIREISISYNLTDIMKNYFGQYISGMTVGISARNVWTTSKYSGIDPELNATGISSGDRGIDFYTTPLPRVYNFWFRINL